VLGTHYTRRTCCIHFFKAQLIFSRAKAHPDVEFRVILNPCSGPCQGSLPDKVYLDEIPKLRLYDNIHPLGYVATRYADKELGSVLAEIDTYANWPKLTNNTKLKVDGIFFDETPSEYVSYKYEYLKTASQAVRNSTKFRDRFVGEFLTGVAIYACSHIENPTDLRSAQPRQHNESSLKY
jgi:hypothetical protein